MSKHAVSVTLDADNLLWLRAQAQAGRGLNISRILDRLVGEARATGKSLSAPSRSVVGTVNLRGFDPVAADKDLRKLFNASTTGHGIVRERRPAYGRKRRKARG